jgi:hypothetical protein
MTDQNPDSLNADDFEEEDQVDSETSSSGSDDESSDGAEVEPASTVKEEVTNVQPMNRKPKFDFAALRSKSSLMSKLPGFLAQMEAANRELEAEKAAGTIASRRLEIDDNEIDDNEEGSKTEQYIEMNLGLGVLEEKTGVSETSSDEESDDEDVMDKLMGAEKDTTGEGSKKKAAIEEL